MTQLFWNDELQVWWRRLLKKTENSNWSINKTTFQSHMPVTKIIYDCFNNDNVIEWGYNISSANRFTRFIGKSAAKTYLTTSNIKNERSLLKNDEKRNLKQIQVILVKVKKESSSYDTIWLLYVDSLTTTKELRL